MRRFLSIFFCLVITTLLPWSVLATDTSLVQRLSGRILLQVESYGRAWYIDPVSQTRVYLQNGEEALRLMRQLGLGITDADLTRIPTNSGELGNKELSQRLAGRIVLQVEQHGEAWYIDPVTLTRTYLPTGEAAYELLRQHGLGITTANLSQIAMNDWQVCPDTAFGNVAAAAYQAGNYHGGQYDATPLPLASLTKLMTVLVANDLIADWNNTATVTAAEIEYPKLYVGDDTTSEINLKAGDELKLSDILSAVLVASSNQSAAVLADATGLSRQDFIALMNKKAAEFGLLKTHFVDVAGLDAHNVSTAAEYAQVAKAAFAVPLIASTSRQTGATLTTAAGRAITVTNRNYSLLKYEPDGVKTGYLIEAQRNAVIQKGDRTIVVLHARSMNERNALVEKYLNN